MYKKVKFLKKCSFKVWPLAKIKTWHLFHRVGGRGTSGYIELDIPTSRSMSGSTEPDILTKKSRSEFCYNSWFHYIEFRGKKNSLSMSGSVEPDILLSLSVSGFCIITWHLFHGVGGRGTSGSIDLDILSERSMSGSTEPDIPKKVGLNFAITHDFNI